MASAGDKKNRTRRDYQPRIEGLEALRLLSAAAQATPLAAVAVEHDLLTDSVPHAAPIESSESLTPLVSSATWDAALVQSHLSELLTTPATSGPASPVVTTVIEGSRSTAGQGDTRAIESGLSQLNKYLSRAWYRAGIPAQVHDDSSQAVYTTMLQNVGRQRFDNLVADVGRWGVKEVFSRESADGLSFFRAVDMVKKRTQRERVHQSLESVDVPAASSEQGATAAWRDVLREAIDQKLSAREAALIEDTMMGKTPAEIAEQWGVAPKTVSNEKTRVLQKLRDALATHEWN